MTHAESAETAARRPTPATILLVLVPFAFGYFLSYFFRAVNAVVAPDLKAELSLGATEIGLLTSAYLFTFALAQLPLGVALDRYGPRRCQTILIAIAAAGALMFALGDGIVELTIARALIGLGFAGGLMGGFKAVAIWVSPQRHALANAWVMSAGALGLLVATAPAEFAVQLFGWRDVFMALAAATLVSAALIWFVVPERPNKTTTGQTLSGQVAGLAQIMRDRVFWAITPMLAATAGTQIAIQTLWAGPWQRDVAGLDRTGAAEVLFVAAIAFFVGVLTSGALADWLLRRGVSLLTTLMGFIVLFIASQIGIILELLAFNSAIWFVFGMTGQTAVLAYPWLARYFGQALAGRSNAAVNLSLFAAAFAIQYAIGLIIDLFPQTPSGGFPKQAYQYAFGTFLALQVLTILWYAVNLGQIRAVERQFGSQSETGQAD
ncbi:MAG: MFS transporter [Pseudomonadota bacterium]